MKGTVTDKPSDQIIQLIGEALIGKDPLSALRGLLPELTRGEREIARDERAIASGTREIESGESKIARSAHAIANDGQSAAGRALNETAAHDEKKLLRVEKQGFYVYYHGYVSAPGDCTNDAEKQFFFVNGLYVKDDRVLKQSLMDAFRKSCKAGAYPYAFLYLKIKPYRLDMFPERNAVAFYDPRNVGAFCKDAVLEALAAK